MTDDGNENSIVSAVEAVLFSCGYPVDCEELCYALNADINCVERAVERLNTRYLQYISGIRVIKLNNSYQLCTEERFAQPIRKALGLKEPAAFSKPALEVLLIIASFQPTTQRFIDNIRGVDSSYWVEWLVERELIEPVGKLDRRGKPKAYATTMDFLRTFHLSSIKDLPEIGSNSPGGAASVQSELALDELEGLI
ncbi:MAG: SMC-Scp complex subunit ScpB [Oscillospiraceae bacterium]|nr:SMC-Scp complex subunit ScpB [Oscillospiraceae bacterium]